MKQQQLLVVIGGGAAGYFGAIQAASQGGPELKVIILEKTNKLLAKVRVSGGGRCNVTNACEVPRELSLNYPRGQKKMGQAFRQFGSKETKAWFTKRGVHLQTEADGRVFPVSNDSQSIINVLQNEAHKLGVEILTGVQVTNIRPESDKVFIEAKNGKYVADYLLLCTGGSPKVAGYELMNALNLAIEPPVPSLFTFNIKNRHLHSLAGISVPQAQVLLAGTKFTYTGPLLITHWGLSGPAVLKNSAFAARYLHEKNYKQEVLVNWSGLGQASEVLTRIQSYIQEHPKRQIGKYALFNFPQRLWQYFLNKIELKPEMLFQDLGKKNLNKLNEVIYRDSYSLEGKTTFKEEFVTCGGISLSEVNTDFSLKKYPNIYAAGEVLDIDGITGGYNFQAAWTTGYIAGDSIATKVKGDIGNNR